MRLNFGEKSEFNNVATSFNNMAEELSLFQKSSMAKIISTKQYLETVINAIKEPILGLNDQKDILFGVICKSPWIKVDMVALFLPQDVAQL